MASAAPKQLRFDKQLTANCWSLVSIVDEKNQATDYVGVRGEFENAETETLFCSLIGKKKFIGISSYQNFPQLNCNPFQNAGYPKTRDAQFIHKYGEHIVLWCHCFKDPFHYIPLSIPRLLYSETDQYAHVANLLQVNEAKKYDCFVSIQDGEWNAWVRGLPILKRWVNYMAEQMHLKILVCGTNRAKDFSPKVTTIDFQPWHLFLKAMSSCRFLLCASTYDASPRIIIEAIGLNVPVVLNEHILGGWKYINDFTGTLFCPDEPVEHKVKEVLRMCEKKQYQPRVWLQENFDVNANKAMLFETLATLAQGNYSDWFDGILYINLTNRADRQKQILGELEKMQVPQEMIVRIDAVLNETCGHLGCTDSHLKALAYAMEKGWNRVLILEDDFVFTVPKERLFYMLREFYRDRANKWDVFMLTAHWKLFFVQTEVDYIKRLRAGTTTAGYIVNGRAYMQKLYNTFLEARSLLATEIKKHEQLHPGKKMYQTVNALDQYWRRLQEQDYFYTTEPHLGKQSASPSSIMA
jgi:hypothetical protein